MASSNSDQLKLRRIRRRVPEKLACAVKSTEASSALLPGKPWSDGKSRGKHNKWMLTAERPAQMLLGPVDPSLRRDELMALRPIAFVTRSSFGAGAYESAVVRSSNPLFLPQYPFAFESSAMDARCLHRVPWTESSWVDRAAFERRTRPAPWCDMKPIHRMNAFSLLPVTPKRLGKGDSQRHWWPSMAPTQHEGK